MIGKQDRWQEELFVAGPLSELIPDDHVLKRVDNVLDLSWLREEVRELYNETQGRPSIDPESAVRLMLAGFFQGIVHDRKLMREAQVNLAIRWFAGYKLHEKLPHHSSLTRIRQRWGAERFKRIFHKTVQVCMDAGLVDGEKIRGQTTNFRIFIRSTDASTGRAVTYVRVCAAGLDDQGNASARCRNSRYAPRSSSTSNTSPRRLPRCVT
jgi:transposase